MTPMSIPYEPPASLIVTSSTLVEVVGYYAYANRIADGLGLETETWIPD